MFGFRDGPDDSDEDRDDAHSRDKSGDRPVGSDLDGWHDRAMRARGGMDEYGGAVPESPLRLLSTAVQVHFPETVVAASILKNRPNRLSVTFARDVELGDAKVRELEARLWRVGLAPVDGTRFDRYEDAVRGGRETLIQHAGSDYEVLPTARKDFAFEGFR